MKTRDIHKRIENILLMGCDIYGEACYEGRELTEAEKRYNSDAMVVLSLDKDSGRIKMASLMRDVWVNIPGYGMEKLNAAFRLGGPELAIQVVNDSFHLNIRKYAFVGIDDMIRVVDLFGGVDMELSDEEAEYINDWVPDVLILTQRKEDIPILERGGYHHLCGVQAVAHVRNRTIGFMAGRENRAHNLIRAFVSKAKSEMSIPQILITAARSLAYIRTNIGVLHGLFLIRFCLKTDLSQVETYHAPAEGTYVVKRDGPWRMETDLIRATVYLWAFLLS